ITNTVNIDGASAPGFAGAPVVEIDNNGFAGLTISGFADRLASLSIVHASGPGVTLLGLGSLGPSLGDDTVVGNDIGLALDGSVAANTGVGLFIDNSSGDTVGGTTPLDRNVISGNGAGGIEVAPSGAFGLTGKIVGNFIGTDHTGQTAAANQGNGITIFAGVGDRGNVTGAIAVGGADAGDGNTIAFNSQYGIVVDTGRGNTISENSIFNNGAGGILLTNNGNNNQPAPVLTAAFQPTPTTIEVSGTLVVPSFQGSGVPYVVEIFATPTGTPTGQGRNFIGSLTVVPNAAGIAPFVFRSSFASASGNSFTATATNGEGTSSTSAFSPALGLSGSANTVFVASTYGLLLNRAPDAAAFWVNGLNGGTLTPASAVLGIEGSEEYIRDQVDAMYLRYLDRAADPPGQQHWVGVVQAGGTFEQVAEGLVSSQEYYVLQGGTDQGFVTGLYHEVLNRNPSTAELAGWETVLDAGASRASVAVGFLTSQEYRTDLVQNDYMTFLLRAADPGGLTFWVHALNAAFTDQEVLAEILGSPEGYQLWS
ncbi:MAG TPA: DUF4214 domain-containing protein, partial [Gemmataceae bacterium]|nr:DUF4214 domain-containing protein [Gemmataceae bacterium]